MRSPRDQAERMRRQRDARQHDDSYVRETFTAPRAEARETAKAWLRRFPKAAYGSEVETWRELPDDVIEFTMRRLRSAD